MRSKRLNPTEAAEFLDMSKATLDTWRSRKLHLPFIRVGGRIQYEESDLIAFLESRKVRPIEQTR